MITRLVKWSIGIRLPFIRPAKKLELKLKYRNNFTLGELLADMTPENCKLEDWENAKPAGKEIW